MKKLDKVKVAVKTTEHGKCLVLDKLVIIPNIKFNTMSDLIVMFLFSRNRGMRFAGGSLSL